MKLPNADTDYFLSALHRQSPTEINAPRGCAVILKRICQLSLTRITHQVSRAFDLNLMMIFVIGKNRNYKSAEEKRNDI